LVKLILQDCRGKRSGAVVKPMKLCCNCHFRQIENVSTLCGSDPSLYSPKLARYHKYCRWYIMDQHKGCYYINVVKIMPRLTGYMYRLQHYMYMVCFDRFYVH